MRFALLYHYDPAEAGPTKGEVRDWLAFEQEAKNAGVHEYEVGFQSARKSRTVSVRDGNVTTEDGPAVTQGQLIAGCWVIDVGDMATAIEWARRIPTAKYGKVEVRPITEYEG
jgi:hypothetical protein